MTDPCVKCYVTKTSWNLGQLKVLTLYIDHSLSLEYLAQDIFCVLKNKNHIHTHLKQFLEHIIQFHKSTYSEYTVTEIVSEVCQLLDVVYRELIEKGFYQLNGMLNFNTLWLELPDTFIFYHMESDDVRNLICP